MPTVIIKDEKTDSPFDILSLRYIEYNSSLKYHDVVAKRDEICSFIEETKLDKSNNSLISLLSLGEKATISESKVSKEMAAIEFLTKKIDSIGFEIGRQAQKMASLNLDFSDNDLANFEKVRIKSNMARGASLSSRELTAMREAELDRIASTARYEFAKRELEKHEINKILKEKHLENVRRHDNERKDDKLGE